MPTVTYRFYLAAFAELDRAEKRLAAQLVAQVEANSAAGSPVDLVWAPHMRAAYFTGNIQAVRANRSDCNRSLALLYRTSDGRIDLLDLLTLPPIPAPPKEPKP